MNTLITGYAKVLETIHKDMATALEGLAEEALDWSPGEAMNSITVLVVHTMGAERFWIGEMVGNDPVQRDRNAEFQSSGLGAAALKHILTETATHSQQILANLNPEDLAKSRYSPVHQREFDLDYALMHALEHTALHLGYIQITRQLWEQREK